MLSIPDQPVHAGHCQEFGMEAKHRNQIFFSPVLEIAVGCLQTLAPQVTTWTRRTEAHMHTPVPLPRSSLSS